jgi:inhibitor of cysteine peptidase
MKRTIILTVLCALVLATALLHASETMKPGAAIGPGDRSDTDSPLSERSAGGELRFPEEGFPDPDAPIAVAQGRTFTLTLRANPTTGYIWQLAEPLDERMLRFIGSAYSTDKTGLMGAGGKEIWTFRTEGCGQAQIRLKYVRPWEKDTPPAKTLRFTLIIGGDIKKQSVTH